MSEEWMKLDNAAKIYPLIESDYITSVYRFSHTLDIEVNQVVLIQSLNHVIKRFPYYKVTLKKGFFWYYLEENHQKLKVYKDNQTPCRRIIPTQTNGYLFRVLYSTKKIIVEFNHILADGTAALIFLNTLVHEYLKLVGFDASVNEWIKDLTSDVEEEEYEDSHSRIGKKYLKTQFSKLDIKKNVFHIKDRLLKRNQYIIVNGEIDSNQLNHIAKKYDCSITVLLTAIYLESLLEIQKEQVKTIKKRKIVSVQVPVNMRKRLKSKSMRNFSLFVIPYLLPDIDYHFEMIIDQVKQCFQDKIEINNLLHLMVQNYKTERSPFVKLLPLGLKKMVTPFIYKNSGVDTYSGTLSNIGKIELPENMEKQVQNIDFLLAPCPITKCSCSITGYKNLLSITFGRNIKEARVEQKFFRKLVQLGVKVKINQFGGDR